MSAKYVNQLPCHENCGSSQSKSDEATPLLVSDISSKELESKNKEDQKLVAELERRYYYDAEVGCLRWKINSPSGRAFIGDRVGSDSGHGYRIFSFMFNKRQVKFYEHRVVWLLVHGYWATELDHINGCRFDNRIENLREVTRTENTRNARKRKDNSSGATGVVWHAAAGKWLSQIVVNGSNIYLGLSTDLEEAIRCRKAAEIKYGYHSNHGRD